MLTQFGNMLIGVAEPKQQQQKVNLFDMLSQSQKLLFSIIRGQIMGDIANNSQFAQNPQFLEYINKYNTERNEII